MSRFLMDVEFHTG